jgi:hypothetical protein
VADLGPSLITGAAVIAGGALAVGGGVVTQLLQGRASAQVRLEARLKAATEIQQKALDRSGEALRPLL